jgi:hypothetical protein
VTAGTSRPQVVRQRVRPRRITAQLDPVSTGSEVPDYVVRKRGIPGVLAVSQFVLARSGRSGHEQGGRSETSGAVGRSSTRLATSAGGWIPVLGYRNPVPQILRSPGVVGSGRRDQEAPAAVELEREVSAQ